MNAVIPLRRAWGATSAEWEHWSETLGLTADLLPLVCRPASAGAVLDASSNLGELGKVPSVFTPAGTVVGLARWTSKMAKAGEVDRWSQQPDYGICLQTRTLRAIDIDVPDQGLSDAIVASVQAWLLLELGVVAPVRSRSNSGKCLLLVRCPGERGKQAVVVARHVGAGQTASGAVKDVDDKVELLASGQQCVVVGTHPSGVPYEWRVDGSGDSGGERRMPELGEIPTLTETQLDELWAALVEEFGLDEAEKAKGLRARGVRARSLATWTPVDDPFANWLADKGLILGEGAGKLFVDCPNKDSHSSDSGLSQTTYMPAGTGGYAGGNFVCLHAGCSDIHVGRFRELLGYVEDVSVMFDVVEDEVDGSDLTGLDTYVRPSYRRDRQGAVLADIVNLVTAIKEPRECGAVIRFDEFKSCIVIQGPAGGWRPFVDADYGDIRHRLEDRGDFKPIGMETLRMAVMKVASDNRFDSAREWAMGLHWDGVERIERWLERYCGVEDSELARAASLYQWTALAGRVVAPGIKADMMVVMTGSQGARKSSMVQAMAPGFDAWTTVSFTDKDDELKRRIRGRLVVEIDELRGLNSRDVEHIKSILSTAIDTWIPKYQEHAVSYARRAMFIGTTNEVEILNDATGHRRFVVIEVGDQLDVEAMERDREQMWAEALERFAVDGIAWQEVERLARQTNEAFRVGDVWDDAIRRYLDTVEDDGTTPLSKGWVTAAEVLQHALLMPLQKITRSEEMRAGRVLARVGLVRRRKSLQGEQLWRWVVE